MGKVVELNFLVGILEDKLLKLELEYNLLFFHKTQLLYRRGKSRTSCIYLSIDRLNNSLAMELLLELVFRLAKSYKFLDQQVEIMEMVLF